MYDNPACTTRRAFSALKIQLHPVAAVFGNGAYAVLAPPIPRIPAPNPTDPTAGVNSTPTMQTATLPRTAPLALWRIAEAFLHVLHSLFGAPEDVAREHTLTRAAHTLMLSWLRVGEALLRRLLLIEAAVYSGALHCNEPGTSVRQPRQRARKRMSFTPENPEDWRVTFRCFSSSPAISGGSVETRSGKTKGRVAPSDRPAGFHSAWPLAERYEALLRVFNAPHAYARRLAKRLHAQPQRLSAVLEAPDEYFHRVDDAEDLTAAAKSAWRKPDTS
jgi:hypothetical protein